MRVLFIAPLPPPVTGHSLASRVLLDALAKTHPVSVIDFRKKSFKQGITSFSRVIRIFSVLKEVWNNSRGQDVIYLTTSESFAGNIKDIFTYLICFKSLHKTVIHVHGGSIRKLLFDKNRILFFVNKFFLRRLGGVIVLGQSHVGDFSDIVGGDRIHVVPNFSEDYLFLNEGEIISKFSKTEPLKILFLSNLIHGKGHNDLVDAYFALPEKIKNSVEIYFAGIFNSEREKSEFSRKIQGAPRLHYRGVVSGIEKRDLLWHAHVFCFPSHLLEGQPLVVLEAYAAGCVVISGVQAGLRDIFTPGVNGYKIQPKSADSLASAIEQVVEDSGKLLPIAVVNNNTAREKYRTSVYQASAIKILETVGQEHYRVCSNCIMDTSDSNISFDERGWCDYCRNYHENIQPNWHPNQKGEQLLAPLIDKIKSEGKGRDHDCLIGISGGVDSSYVAYLAKEKFGLKPLLLHVDAGWNSQVSTNNIEKLIDGLNLDLHTEVVDWLEMKDVQLSFLKAQVPHIDSPQDHAFFASLYNFAAKNGFKYILTGANYSTECVREPLEWHYHATDLRQFKDIHRRFGQRPLKNFPLTDIFKYKLYYRYFKGIRIVKPLDCLPFVKEEAMQDLVTRFGWQKYAHKHYESRFTRFCEGYWLPKKFGYDKRRAHFSSLILTKQMTREEALKRIAQPAYDEREMMQDFEYVATKLDLTVPELQEIMAGKNKTFRDYKSSMPLINLGTAVLRALGMQKAILR